MHTALISANSVDRNRSPAIAANRPSLERIPSTLPIWIVCGKNGPGSVAAVSSSIFGNVRRPEEVKRQDRKYERSQDAITRPRMGAVDKIFGYSPVGSEVLGSSLSCSSILRRSSAGIGQVFDVLESDLQGEAASGKEAAV